MKSPRDYIRELIENKQLSVEHIDKALVAVGGKRTVSSWYQFIDNFLLILGSLFLSFSLLFFIAFNWDALGQFFKFALLESFILLAFFVYWKVGAEKMSGKMMLFLISIFMGILLAIYGQSYPTGTDTWEFFIYWAILVLPFALMGRFSAIWILLVLLINLAAVSYFFTFGIYLEEPKGLMQIVLYFLPFIAIFHMKLDSSLVTTLLLLLFFFNSIVLLVIELLNAKYQWFKDRWLMGTLFVLIATTIGLLMMDEVRGIEHIAIVLLWIVWVFVLFYLYLKMIPDFFILVVMVFWVDILFFIWLELKSPTFSLFIVIWIGMINFIFLKKIEKKVHYEQ